MIHLEFHVEQSSILAMKKRNPSNQKHEIGKLGEDIAERHLVSSGHKIEGRNFRKPYGEIDIISSKNGITYFVEVKAGEMDPVTRETGYRPEEHVHPQKLKRLERMVSTYIEQFDIKDWEFLILAIDIDRKAKRAYVRKISEVL